MPKFDLAIIGSGSAGYVAGIRAAQLGMKVCIAEKGELGGVCLNEGCIPTKAILASTELLRMMREAQSLGLRAGQEVRPQVEIDFTKLMERKARIVKKLTGGVNFLLKQNGIEVLHGVATIREPGCLIIDNNEVRAKSIIIATGSKPAIPFKEMRPQIDRKSIITHREALNFDKLPASILIIGAGAIGVEFATIFGYCGAKVTLVEMLPSILPEIRDEKITHTIQESLKSQGITVLVGNKVDNITITQEEVITSLSGGEQFLTDKVLVACGRVPNSDGFESLGLKMDGHQIIVDKHMRTNIPHIYASGDVTGPPLLAHKASKEGVVAAENVSGLDSKMDYNSIPNCIFSYPEIAYVGKFESELDEPMVGEYQFGGTGKALCIGEPKGFVKVVANKGGKVKGVQIIGPHASDLIGIGVIGVKKGLPANELGELIYPHPTLSECLKEAFLDVGGRAIHKI